METAYSERGQYRLAVTDLGDGGTYYVLVRDPWPGTPKIVLAFSVTRQGWLIGDGRDQQTARRAQRLAGQWC